MTFVLRPPVFDIIFEFLRSIHLGQGAIKKDAARYDMIHN